LTIVLSVLLRFVVDALATYIFSLNYNENTKKGNGGVCIYVS
jgi:hypothetical protein